MLAITAIKAIKLYQICLRPALPFCCRFSPNCSEYAQQAIARYGFWQGIFIAGKRILSCHPFSGRSGYDPLL